jgi:hypothetical protein
MVHAPLIAGAPAYPLRRCVVLCCIVLCCVVLCCAVVVVVSYVYNDKELRNDMDQDGSEAGWTHGKTTQVYHFLPRQVDGGLTAPHADWLLGLSSGIYKSIRKKQLPLLLLDRHNTKPRKNLCLTPYSYLYLYLCTVSRIET